LRSSMGLCPTYLALVPGSKIIYEESFLPKKLFAVSLRGSNSHWLLWRP
jgi:hypothetical protein